MNGKLTKVLRVVCHRPLLGALAERLLKTLGTIRKHSQAWPGLVELITKRRFRVVENSEGHLVSGGEKTKLRIGVAVVIYNSEIDVDV